MTTQDLISLVKKNPVSFACGILSLALAVGIYLRGGAAPAAEADLAEKSSTAERLKLNIQYSAQLKEQSDALAAAIKQIDSRIIRTSQVGMNTQYFYKLVAETGVKILDLRQSGGGAKPAAPAKGTFVPVAFSVSVQGDLAQILEFLRLVENGTHYSRVLTATCNGNAMSRNTPLALALNLELLGLP